MSRLSVHYSLELILIQYTTMLVHTFHKSCCCWRCLWHCCRAVVAASAVSALPAVVRFPLQPCVRRALDIICARTAARVATPSAWLIQETRPPILGAGAPLLIFYEMAARAESCQRRLTDWSLLWMLGPNAIGVVEYNVLAHTDETTPRIIWKCS